jgi:hypothetical protein
VELQSHLFKVVLTIYFRIVHSDQENLELWKKYKLDKEIYDEWIFDMPKLFNFIDIYGVDNPLIVKGIVKKVFSINDSYVDDFRDVLKELEKIMENTFRSIKYIHDRAEFDENPS